MNEFLLKDALVRGISPRADMPRDSQSFAALEGVMTSDVGIVPCPTQWEPLASWIQEEEITVDPPFPQIYCGRALILVFLEQAVYNVSLPAGDDWDLTEITFKDALSVNKDYEIVAGGGQWTIADLGGEIVASNFRNMLLLQVSRNTFYGTNYIRPYPCVEHQTRLLYGFYQNTLDEWCLSLMERYLTHGEITLWGYGMAARTVYWTAHGAEDFLWRLWPWMMIYGTHGTTPSLLYNGWFLYGTDVPEDWSINGDVSYDHTNYHMDFFGDGEVSQNITGLAAGTYIIHATITVESGSVRVSLGDNVGPNITTSIVHYWAERTVTSGINFSIVGEDFTGTVTNVICAPVLQPDVYNLERPFFLDYQARNDMGMMPLPRCGEIKALKSINEGVLVFGTESVSLLVPIVEPEPTFGHVPLIPSGPLWTHSVCGDGALTTFVDKAGCIWQIRGTKVERLDYQYLNLSTPKSAFNPLKRETYFNVSDDGTYCISESGGLTFVPRQIASGDVWNGKWAVAQTAARFTGFHAVSETLDFGVRDLKTVRGVYVALASGTVVDVIIEYRTLYSGSWAIGARGSLKQSGWLHCMTSGIEFRLTLDSDGQDIEIDYIRILWESLQKMSIREVLHG